MNLFTEKEYHQQSQHYSFRLRNLYLYQPEVFDQLKEFLTQPIYINHRESLNYEYFSDLFLSYGKEIENLFLKGSSYLPEISNLPLLNASLKKARKLHLNNDLEEVCNYLQCISLNGEMTPYFTNKILLNDEYSLNSSFFLNENSAMEKIFKEIVPWGKDSLIQWQRFQTLTKREKQIIKFIAKGKSSQEICEILIISKHSVNTHRKNIYRKLDVCKTADIVKVSLALELL
jgi:DNA-binding CsgD family transcriptional regulator